MGQQASYTINLTGGLNLVDTYYSLQQQPGACKDLINFEPSVKGGYRRINGYQKFGQGSATQPTGSADEILAVMPYADGCVAVAGTGVYFSDDGITWSQVNRDTYTAGTGTVAVTNGGSGFIDVTGSGTTFTTQYEVDGHIRIDGNIRQIASITSDTAMTLETEIAGGVTAGATAYYNGTTTLSGSVLTRTNQGTSQITFYEGNDQYGTIAITDTTSNNLVGVFKIIGDGGSRAYYYDELDSDWAAPVNPKFCTVMDNRLIVANTGVEGKNVVAYGDRFDFGRFDGASAGTLEVDGEITALYPYKDRLIIFCKNSIYSLVNIDDPANIQIVPISAETGCIATFSVQEAGNDLIFLSQDGVRLLSATDKYGDVTFGTISEKIYPFIEELLDNLNLYQISSTYLRSKNQYRLYFTSSSSTSSDIIGLVATNKLGLQGGLEWQWGKLQGILPSSVDSIFNTDISPTNSLISYFGGYDGYVYEHDTGDSFDGSDITAWLELTDIDYGNIGQKKTLHYVRVFGTTEGASDPLIMGITYDFGDTGTHQPSNYSFPPTSDIAVYGTAVYDTAVFGGRARFQSRLSVHGSGYSNNFTFQSSGTGAPYNLDGIYIDLRVGALL